MANNKQLTKMSVIRTFLKDTGDEFEGILVEKDGNRKIQGGVKSLYTEKIRGQLWKSAENIMQEQIRTIAILVGSTSSMIMWPPTDTDGPGGAFALANTLVQMGKRVIIICDSVNSDQILPAFRQIPLGKDHSNDDQVEFIVFDCSTIEGNEEKMFEIFDRVDHIVNVGRPGPSISERYWSHDERDMTNYQPDFPLLFEMAKKSKSQERKVWTTAIGELGNELGMGQIVQSVNTKVPSGEKIACHQISDFTIVATVTNWGAWGLCAMLALSYIAYCEEARYTPIEKFLPSKKVQSVILETLVNEESRCGVTMTRDHVVDDFSAEENWKFLENLCASTRSRNVDLGELFEKGYTKRTDEEQIPRKLIVTP